MTNLSQFPIGALQLTHNTGVKSKKIMVFLFNLGQNINDGKVEHFDIIFINKKKVLTWMKKFRW